MWSEARSTLRLGLTQGAIDAERARIEHQRLESAPVRRRDPDERIVVIDEVSERTSVEAILDRHGEERLSPADLKRHFGELPSDGES